MVSAALQSTSISSRPILLATAGWFGLALMVSSGVGVSGPARVESPTSAEVCAVVARNSERAIVWTTSRDRVLLFHFAIYTPDGKPRVGPVRIGTGGQVEASCGLAFRDGHYAVALPHYDDLSGHEGDLSFAKLDPETGLAEGGRVLDSTKGGDEHTVESLTPTDDGYILRFHTTANPRSRQLDLDGQGNVEGPSRGSR